MQPRMLTMIVIIELFKERSFLITGMDATSYGGSPAGGEFRIIRHIDSGR